MKRHPGTIRQRGDSYRVRLCVGGKVTSFTVGTGDKRVAEAKARARYAELKREHARRVEGLTVTDVIRFSALLAHFEEATARDKCAGTVRSYRDSLKPIRRYFVDVLGDKLTVDKVRARHIEDYLAWRRTARLQGNHKKVKGAVSARTVNKDRTILRRLFVVAERRDYCASNPVKRTEAVKGDRQQWTILTDEQYDALLRACEGNPQLALYVLVLGEAGLRCDSEALHLRFEDIELSRRFLRVVSGRDGHRTKTGKSREVGMSDRLTEALREHFAAHRVGSDKAAYLFVRDGKRLASLRGSFKGAARRAGLPTSFRQHDLRHRWVTVQADAGRPIQDVQYEAGHASITTTMLYYKQTPPHTRRPQQLAAIAV